MDIFAPGGGKSAPAPKPKPKKEGRYIANPYGPGIYVGGDGDPVLNAAGSLTKKVWNSAPSRATRGAFNELVYYGGMAGRGAFSAPLAQISQSTPVYRNANKQDPQRFPMRSWKQNTLDPEGGMLKNYNTLLKARDATGEPKINPWVQGGIRVGGFAMDILNPVDAVAFGAGAKAVGLTGKGIAAVGGKTKAGATLIEKGAQHKVGILAHRTERKVVQATRLEGHGVIKEITKVGEKHLGGGKFEGASVAGTSVGRVIDAGADAAVRAKQDVTKGAAQARTRMTQAVKTNTRRAKTAATRRQALEHQAEVLGNATRQRAGTARAAQGQIAGNTVIVKGIKGRGNIKAAASATEKLPGAQLKESYAVGAMDRSRSVSGIPLPQDKAVVDKLHARVQDLRLQLDVANASGDATRIAALEKASARAKEKLLIAKGGSEALQVQAIRIQRVTQTLTKKQDAFEAAAQKAQRALDGGLAPERVTQQVLKNAAKESAVARELAVRAESKPGYLPQQELRRLVGLTQEHVANQSKLKSAIGKPYGLIDDFSEEFLYGNYLKRKYLKDVDRAGFTDWLDESGASADDVAKALGRENPVTQVTGPRNPINKAAHDRIDIPAEQRAKMGEIVDARVRIALGDQEAGSALGRIVQLGELSPFVRRESELGGLVREGVESRQSPLKNALRWVGLGDNPYVRVPDGTQYGSWLGTNLDPVTYRIAQHQRDLDAAMKAGDVAAAEKAADALDAAKVQLGELQAAGPMVRTEQFANDPTYIPAQVLQDFQRNTRQAGWVGLGGDSKIFRGADAVINTVAALKVPFSPMTRAANRVSNRIMATQYGGMPPVLGEKYLQMGAAARKSENAWFKEAVSTDPVFSAGLMGDRAAELDTTLTLGGNRLQRLSSQIQKSYGTSELDDKLGGYIWRRTVKGDTPQEAANWVRNTFLDYGEAPHAARWLGDTSAYKFARFPFLSTMAWGKSLGTNPMGTTSILNASRDWDYAVGGTPEGRQEIRDIQRSAPPYYRHGILKALPAPSSVLPWLSGSGDMRPLRNDMGDIYNFDATRFSPIGAALSVGSETTGLLNPYRSNMVFKPIDTIMTGKDKFTGRDVWTEGMPLPAKLLAGGQVALEGALPPQAPGGNLWNTAAGAALFGKLGPDGTPIDPRLALLRWVTGISVPTQGLGSNLDSAEARMNRLNAENTQYMGRLEKQGYDWPWLMNYLSRYNDKRLEEFGSKYQ